MLGIIAILIAVKLMFFPSPPPPIVVVFEKVQKRNITQLVSGSGEIRPEIEVKLAPEVSGEIISLPVVEGQKVKRGDLLFRINPTRAKEELNQATASLHGMKAQTLQVKARLLQAQDNLRRQQELYEQKLISEIEYISLKTNVEIEDANYQAAIFNEKRQESILRQSEEQLERTSVFSPIDGIVTLVNSKLGERVVGAIQNAGTEILRVADLSQMEVQLDVNENDIVKVSLNDTALIYVDAYPKITFEGIVREIANVAKTKGTGTQEQVTNFLVKIRIRKKDTCELKTGMTSAVDVKTETARNVLSVPIQSVTTRNASSATFTEAADYSKDKVPSTTTTTKKRFNNETIRVVFIKENNIVRQYPVETGISDNGYIEIKKGLDEDMEVVAGSYKAISKELSDSSRVTEQKNDFEKRKRP
ncbi:hypothetical protein CHS0354_024102 [Potamilus streckersoni]|uniref:Efflux RND transporter periplasmic adaptor subunit n=1 Tax=Potamilus streckersoni TaxID=2493646 RepID=A0AAE0RZU9_9BIVA|nr:hypothetical protein CHS0354_024102 [Potamilus streckersoni]